MVKASKNAKLTPTQLRNARKRRSKQKARIKAQPKHQQDELPPQDHQADPSQRYIKNPRNCPIAKAAKSFFVHSKKIKFPIFLGSCTGWRTVAKLAVRNLDGHLRLGLFAPKSHVLIPASKSPAHHASINAVVELIESTAADFGISAYDETSGTGLLRHVMFAVEHRTGRVQVTLVVQERGPKSQLERFASALAKKRPSLWHSIWIHTNASWKHANNIVSNDGEFVRLYTSDNIETTCPFGGITETLQQDVPLHFPPSVFRQANLKAFHAIVKSIQKYLETELKQPPTCVELYGGVGTIGLHLSKLCAEITSSDENPHNVECFNKSLTLMGCTTVRYISASAEQMVQRGALAKAQCVIVDPPRKGLDSAVANYLSAAKHVTSLVYVSCGFPAFQRDCEILEHGGFSLHQAEGHILFPGSDAIETLAFFRRT